MLLLWRRAGQLPACSGPAQLPLRKYRLSQLFAAWQSCQGCTHSSQFSPPTPAGWHGWPALALWVVASYLATQLPELPWLAQLASLVSPSCPPVAADAFHWRKALKFCGAGQRQRGAGPELPPSTRAAYPHRAGTQLPPSTRAASLFSLPSPVWQPTHFPGGKRLDSAGERKGGRGAAAGEGWPATTASSASPELLPPPPRCLRGTPEPGQEC